MPREKNNCPGATEEYPSLTARTSTAPIGAKGGKMDRTKGIGGSDVAAIYGVSPWRMPLQIYLERIGESAEMLS